MRKQFNNFFKLSFKLILGQLQAIFAENIIRVSSQNFGNSESTNLKIYKWFETLSALDFKTCVSFKAMFDNK